MPFLSFYCQKRSPSGTANRQRKGTQSLENNRIFDFFAFPLGIYPGLRKKENMLKSLCPFRLPAAVCAAKFAVRSKTFFRPIFLSIAHGFRGYRRRKAKSFFCFALHPFYAKYIPQIPPQKAATAFAFAPKKTICCVELKNKNGAARLLVSGALFRLCSKRTKRQCSSAAHGRKSTAVLNHSTLFQTAGIPLRIPPF